FKGSISVCQFEISSLLSSLQEMRNRVVTGWSAPRRIKKLTAKKSPGNMYPCPTRDEREVPKYWLVKLTPSLTRRHRSPSTTPQRLVEVVKDVWFCPQLSVPYSNDGLGMRFTIVSPESLIHSDSESPGGPIHLTLPPL